jgi:hypothetical protein
MRRLLLAVLCLPLIGAATACAQLGPGPASTPSQSQSDDDRRAVLIAVLRRYLTTPAENSFPGGFANVYVLDRTGAEGTAARSGSAAPGRPISLTDQQAVVESLRDMTSARFVHDTADVVVTIDGCDQVRDGILVMLGEPAGRGDRVEVPVHGFVACLGATWLTYVVQRDGLDWRVTGTVGGIAVA